MSAEQDRVLNAFIAAINQPDYDLARDLVTKIRDPKSKKSAYYDLRILACMQGNIFRMIEVAPFDKTTLSEEEIRHCLDRALINGDVRNVVQCKKMLGENISVKELGQLKNPDEGAGICARQSSKSYLLEFIRSRLGDSLTPEEIVKLRYIEIQIGRGESD